MIDIFIWEFMQALAFSEAGCQFPPYAAHTSQRAKVQSVILIYLVCLPPHTPLSQIKDRFIPELQEKETLNIKYRSERAWTLAAKTHGW